ncbi:MAG: DNA-deoxyinosine glycosylase [Desulfobulbaceae bacterium]|nr:MAG: DNA-deoxyinosine glycosylase [Desulfobulbaceae bacterium]
MPPISTPAAKVLILGSIPGQKSLEEQCYYAHPRNGFWPIMAQLLGGNPREYREMVTVMQTNRVGIWDVIKSCERSGSLDSAIDNNSIKVNNFDKFFRDHPFLKAVFFNGRKAEQEYFRFVEQTIFQKVEKLHYQRLPSTSPAMATMGLAEKVEHWRIILKFL